MASPAPEEREQGRASCRVSMPQGLITAIAVDSATRQY